MSVYSIIYIKLNLRSYCEYRGLKFLAAEQPGPPVGYKCGVRRRRREDKRDGTGLLNIDTGNDNFITVVQIAHAHY